MTILDKDLIRQKLYLNRIIVDRCWWWNGSTRGKGYGSIRIQNKLYSVHRLILYLDGKLDINNSNEIACHINECESKLCFNPDHLYKGDLNTNGRDYSNKVQSGPFRCGHERTPENSYIQQHKQGHTAFLCKTCELERNKRNKEKYLEKNRQYSKKYMKKLRSCK